ncbi:MAG: hypothetical protein RRB13_02650 [bacterium]|nr:hypothetical protein [bacterium]
MTLKTLILLLCSLGLVTAAQAAKKADPPTCPQALDPAKVKKYQLIMQEYSGSTDIYASIYAPYAKTIEERAQTAMQAALEIQKDTQARDVSVRILRAPNQPETPWRANASFNPEAHRDKHVVWRVVSQVKSRPRYNAQFTTYCQQWEPSKLKPLKSTQVDHIKPPPPEIHHTADGIFCAFSREAYDRASQLENTDAVIAMTESPAALFIKEDMEVYLEDESHKMFLILRPKDWSLLIWCAPDALKD